MYNATREAIVSLFCLYHDYNLHHRWIFMKHGAVIEPAKKKKKNT